MSRLNKQTGQWEKTPKEIEREKEKAAAEAKIATQSEQIDALTLMIGDIMMGGM
jgi:hypothetical protein